VLYAGLSGALYALDTLFSLDVAPKRYGQLWVLTIGLFGIIYFLAQIPKDTKHLVSHTYTKVETIFTKYLLTPLVVGYFVILYAYTLKILVTQSWPKGILAWIIIAFSAVAITAYLFWTPIWSEKAKRYKRFFALALWLQTIMLATALWMRIQAYGWTESRYMVALLGAWLFVVSLYFLLFKGARYKWMFASLSLLIMISQIGPFSAYAIGKKSQQQRLQEILSTHQPLSSKTPRKIRYEISDKLQYLATHFGVESLENIVPDIVKKFRKTYPDRESYREYSFASFATKELGFNYIDKWQYLHDETPSIGFFRPRAYAQHIAGYEWICDVRYSVYRGRDSALEESEGSIIPEINTSFRLDNKALTIQENNHTIATIPLESFYKKVSEDEALQNSYAVERVDNNWSKKLDIPFENENVKVKVQFYEIQSDDNGSSFNAYAQVLYKRK